MLIAYALLCGCDYDSKGVPGIGQLHAEKFLNDFYKYQQTYRARFCILSMMRDWPFVDTHFNYFDSETSIREMIQKKNIKNVFPNENIINEYFIHSQESKEFLENTLIIQKIKIN